MRIRARRNTRLFQRDAATLKVVFRLSRAHLHFHNSQHHGRGGRRAAEQHPQMMQDLFLVADGESHGKVTGARSLP
jgi:hypothetical protein